MTEDLKKYSSSIKKEHSIAWTPKFEEEFRTNLNKTVFIPIAVQTFEKLGWDLLYQDEDTAKAQKGRTAWDWGQEIKVTYKHGKVHVKSVSVGNEFWDRGRNSKRVKLFIYAFKQTEKEYDKEALKELEEEVIRVNNWDDYEIPESLPQAKKRREPKLWMPVIGGILTALLLGFLVAFLSLKGVYVIGLFEVGVALAMAFALKLLIRASNYTFFEQLHYLLIGMIVLTYLSNQYFQYKIILAEDGLSAFGFGEFMQARWKAGLTIKSLNTGWIGLLISWVVQLVLTYIIGALRFISSLTVYQVERIPMEVIEFASYHLIKDKTEAQVRSELSKMGWTEKENQDEVFEAIGALENATELNGMD